MSRLDVASTQTRAPWLLWSNVILLLVLYHLTTFRQEEMYSSFTPIVWQESLGCAPAKLPEGTLFIATSRGNFSVGEVPHRCESLPFQLAGQVLSLELIASEQLLRDNGLTVTLVSEGGEQYRFSPFSSLQEFPSQWEWYSLHAPKVLVGTKVRLVIEETGAATSANWFGVRNRVDVNMPLARLSQGLSKWVESKTLSVVVAILLGTTLSLLTVRVAANSSPVSFFSLLAVLGPGLHFRWNLTFHLDEWIALGRFLDYGIEGVLYTHNEHFLPLFYLLYFVEMKSFGLFYPLYLAVSGALFLINCALLTLFLYRLTESFPRRSSAVFGAVAFFALSSLHMEALQLAYSQCILLCQAAILTGLLLTLDYLKEGNERDLLALALVATACPLLFGGGYVLPIVVALVVVICALRGTSFRRSVLRESAVLGIVSFVIAALFLLQYRYFRTGDGHTLNLGHAREGIPSIGEYVAVGSQVGTFLRGIGVFPSLQVPPATSHPLLYSSAKLVPDLPPLLTAAWFGAALSALLLLFSLLNRGNRRNVLVLFLFGELFIAANLLLPGLVRWNLGIGQSLALRYHTLTAIGLSVIVFPVIYLFSERAFHQSGFGNGLLLFCGKFVAAVVFSIHVLLITHYEFFSESAWATRNFVAKMKEWHSLALQHGVDYQPGGQGTPALSVLEPTKPSQRIPNLWPDEIYLPLHKLSSEQYPYFDPKRSPSKERDGSVSQPIPKRAEAPLVRS